MFLMNADVGFGDHQVTCSLAFIEPDGLVRTNCVMTCGQFSFSPCVRRNRGYIILMPGFVFPNDRCFFPGHVNVGGYEHF